MLSYTGTIDLYKDLSENSVTANVTRGNTMINEGIRQVIGKLPFNFLEATTTASTVASQQFYNNPYNMAQLTNVTVLVGTTLYTPKEAPNKGFWDRLNQSSTPESDIPEWFFTFNGQTGFYPTPSGTSGTIRWNYRKRVKNISIADYTTGTLTNTNGSTVITGSGTTFTAAMVGRWIKLGDLQWYEIDTFTSTTVIGLKKNFEGTTAGSISFTLGEISDIPEDYQILPLYYALSVYWGGIGKDNNKATLYKNLYDEGIKDMTARVGMGTDNVRIDEGEQIIKNPNLFVTQ